MAMETTSDVLGSVREAASSAEDIRAEVRRLVTGALLKREADPKAIKSVIQATVEGVGEGLGQRTGNLGDALKEAMTGMDEAVAKSVYAVQMAVEEAWGQGRDFADADLREAYTAVKNLEDDMMATLKQTGDKAQGTLKTEFESLRDHLARTGTDTGAQVKTVLKTLNDRFNAAASGSAGEAKEAASEAAGRLAAVTSGVLRGLADALDQKLKS